MNPRNFFAELKRRNVYKVAVAYAVVAWLLIQVATQVFPFFGIPNWAVRLVVLLLALGFPVALILSWAFEITPEGIKRAEDVAPNESIRRQTGHKIVGITVALALIAAGLFFFRLWQTKATEEPVTKPAATASAVPTKSIAVLPFENLSEEKGNVYFAQGIQDEILMRLTNIADLRVISRTSTQRFKSSPDNVREIAQQLGVVHILEGSVQRTTDQVRVNVQLINAQKDTHLWAETYDRKLTDIFAVEAEIARSVAEMLQAKLTGSAERLLASRPTENSEAHELYLKGKFYDARGNEADYRKAIDLYKEAVRLDPRYALAYTDLSVTFTNLARKFLNGEIAHQAYMEARAAADAALALEPDLAAAHAARGLVLESLDFDWNGAETEYRRAIQLAPNDGTPKTALASLLAILGRPEEAIPLAREELKSDPLCASCYHWLSDYLSPLGRLDEAEQAIRRAIELQPGHADFYTQLTVIAIQRGDAQAALAAAKQEVTAGGWQEIALALAQQISGDPAAADAALKTLIDKQANDAAYQIAQVYSLRNDPDKVFEWLDRAWSNRDPGVSQLLYDPFIIRYRHDPRFAAYCRKVGLPVPGDRAGATGCRALSSSCWRLASYLLSSSSGFSS